MQRRQFLKSLAATGSGLVILPSGARGGPDAPSNKLNIALIGVWGRGQAHQEALSSENVVALCDVDENHLAEAAEEVSQGQDLRRLAQVPRSEGPRCRGLLHRRITPTRSSPTGR